MRRGRRRAARMEPATGALRPVGGGAEPPNRLPVSPALASRWSYGGPGMVQHVFGKTGLRNHGRAGGTGRWRGRGADCSYSPRHARTTFLSPRAPGIAGSVVSPAYRLRFDMSGGAWRGHCAGVFPVPPVGKSRATAQASRLQGTFLLAWPPPPPEENAAPQAPP
eukprot:gene8801-biopygen15198